MSFASFFIICHFWRTIPTLPLSNLLKGTSLIITYRQYYYIWAKTEGGMLGDFLKTVCSAPLIYLESIILAGGRGVRVIRSVFTLIRGDCVENYISLIRT